jgi:hypothetical protein
MTESTCLFCFQVYTSFSKAIPLVSPGTPYHRWRVCTAVSHCSTCGCLLLQQHLNHRAASDFCPHLTPPQQYEVVREGLPTRRMDAGVCHLNRHTLQLLLAVFISHVPQCLPNLSSTELRADGAAPNLAWLLAQHMEGWWPGRGYATSRCGRTR